MGLDAKQVKRWANGFNPDGDGLSWSEIAKQAGMPLRTLTVQRSKNNIDANLVFEIARYNHRDPVGELSQFAGFASLSGDYPAPSTRELLTQVDTNQVFSEIAYRLGEVQRKAPQLSRWGSMNRGLVAWLGLAGRDYGVTISKVLNISDAGASRKVNLPQFKVEQIVPVCDALGLNPKFALLVLGYLTDEETGVSSTAREDALVSATGDELADHLSHVLRHIRRQLQIAQQKTEDDEIARRLT